MWNLPFLFCFIRAFAFRFGFCSAFLKLNYNIPRVCAFVKSFFHFLEKNYLFLNISKFLLTNRKKGCKILNDQGKQVIKAHLPAF